MGRVQRLGFQLVGIAITLAVWEIVGRLMGEALLAAPSVVIREYAGLVRDGTMLADLIASLRQMLVGFGLACVLGAPMGIAMGRSRVCDLILHPWVSMLVVLSVAALVPLFLLLFGSGFEFRAAIVFMASVGPLVAGAVMLVTVRTAPTLVATPAALLITTEYVAASAREAWDLMHEKTFDLVLMDIQLPDINGIEAFGRIRGHAGTAKVPVVAFTASVTANDRSRITDAGFDGFLGKPINLKDFVDTVQRTVGPA